ncbi:hypothetical protein [Psychromonas sp. Urea-02u-13]|uniref:hypothetical protein n=1 Tax=Psychromonas sp. Urea-02u-13 TaxID=2058326 RepID=UPI000C34D3AB|nr:hypothetical protein [Psychromonas sp. Urea-02u-13]PKG38969.1 hypothetical protein CXF74_11005 [Psychromonas sp. Urea-02u-13]
MAVPDWFFIFKEIDMHDENFIDCREFLERMIESHPDNNEFIKAYIKLFEKKTEYDIAIDTNNLELDKVSEESKTERLKSENEVEKSHIVNN